MDKIGLRTFIPLVRLVTGEDPTAQLNQLMRTVGIPVLAVGMFLLAWNGVAASIQTSIGSVPGPAAVWSEWKNLVAGLSCSGARGRNSNATPGPA